MDFEKAAELVILHFLACQRGDTKLDESRKGGSSRPHERARCIFLAQEWNSGMGSTRSTFSFAGAQFPKVTCDLFLITKKRLPTEIDVPNDQQ